MGLATELLRFFSADINDGNRIHRTLDDFVLQPHYANTANMYEIIKIINIFKTDGTLISLGHDYSKSKSHINSEVLVSFSFKEDVAKYGSYDFKVNGFREVAEHFSRSVRPIIVKKKSGDFDIGTGFLLGNCFTLVTARHVVENAELIQIPNLKNEWVTAERITFSKNSNVDIAIIFMKHYDFMGVPAFNVKDGKILEDILTIGYPPIPGFDAIQIYEKATINNFYKLSKGQIVGISNSYLDSIEYLIINAKVKGGNSGSPVINEFGNLVGMVVQIPFDSQDSSKLDSLGYGIVTPKSEIYKMLEGVNYIPQVDIYDVENLGDGFRIKK